MSTDILDFVRDSFPSVWALELMMFLQEDPQRSWSADDLEFELRGSPVIVELSLASLTDAGIVAAGADKRFRYQPASDEVDRLARATANLYRKKPDAVRRVILSSSTTKFQTLADAFKLKRD